MDGTASRGKTASKVALDSKVRRRGNRPDRTDRLGREGSRVSKDKEIRPGRVAGRADRLGNAADSLAAILRMESFAGVAAQISISTSTLVDNGITLRGTRRRRR